MGAARAGRAAAADGATDGAGRAAAAVDGRVGGVARGARDEGLVERGRWGGES